MVASFGVEVFVGGEKIGGNVATPPFIPPFMCLGEPDVLNISRDAVK